VQKIMKTPESANFVNEWNSSPSMRPYPTRSFGASLSQWQKAVAGARKPMVFITSESQSQQAAPRLAATADEKHLI